MEWIKISTSTELVRLPADDIVFVRADGNYSDVYAFHDAKPHKMTFKLHYFDEAFRGLARSPFVRVGKSLIVNRRYIRIVNLPGQELTLSGRELDCDFRLRASREALRELKDLLEKGDDTND